MTATDAAAVRQRRRDDQLCADLVRLLQRIKSFHCGDSPHPRPSTSTPNQTQEHAA